MTQDEALAAQRRMVEALRDPARYPHPVGSIALIETHISFVLLTGGIAYKIKKAVDLGFVDYTALDKRRFYCAEELRLNRRLAPRLYRDVVAISGSAAEPRLADGGEAIEYAVRMAEFAQPDLLDRVLARGELTTAQLDALAAVVAAFHAGIPAAAADEVYGSPGSVWAPVDANFAHLRALGSFDGPLLAALEDWSRSEHRRLREVFAERKAAGFVRECHGDLHLGNMALVGGEPMVFDCIEFNPGLRWIDVVSDLAFLVMDLAERGHPDYAWRLLNDWLEVTGDHAGLGLLRFYQVYRAVVRAKVAGIRAAGRLLSAAERHAAQADANRYLAYASRLTVPPPRALLFTHGFSGAGKSTLARAVAQTLGAVHLRSDVERKRLHRLPPLARSASGLDDGLYAEAASAATYERLADLAATVLAAGYSVVIDAACLQRGQRQRFRALANDLGVPVLILDCQAQTALLRQRVEQRAAGGGDASEASPAVLERQIARAEPLAPEELAITLAVDGAADGFDAAMAQIRQRLGSIA